jgi:cytochrome oxidase Cu insertion factor (SCO1/SenC/PrrC family)
MAIANAVEKSSFVYLYNEKGNQIKAISLGGGKLVGFTATTVNIKRSGFIYMYDEKGNIIKAIPSK